VKVDGTGRVKVDGTEQVKRQLKVGCHQCHNLRRNWWHTLTVLELDTPKVTGREGSSEATDEETVRQKDLKMDI
jgi:hypothetical protein